jgi:ESCRT-II complex subunit VPS36
MKDLIPPSTFIQVLPLLPLYTSPSISMRTFNSKLKVVHTPWFSQRSFDSRLETFLDAAGPKTTIQIATQENISVALVAEIIENAEREGKLLRAEGGGLGDRVDGDDQDGGSRVVGVVGGMGGDDIGGKEIWWWPNYFRGYVWDGD